MAVWIGEPTSDEAGLACEWLAERICVTQVSGFRAAAELQLTGDPMVVVFPLPWSGAVEARDLPALARRWPLSPLVAVCMSVVDGRRRSGPALPGVLDVPWHDLPARVEQWLRHRDAGMPTSLGLPRTIRREERLLAARSDHGCRPATVRDRRPLTAALAAASRSDLDSLADLAIAAGCRVSSRRTGRPSPGDAGDVVLWDLPDHRAEPLSWIARMADSREARPLILFDSFPRGSMARALKAAGRGHLLARPAEADVLADTIDWCLRAASDALGRPPGHR
jgi:hypothetical protein